MVSMDLVRKAAPQQQHVITTVDATRSTEIQAALSPASHASLVQEVVLKVMPTLSALPTPSVTTPPVTTPPVTTPPVTSVAPPPPIDVDDLVRRIAEKMPTSTASCPINVDPCITNLNTLASQTNFIKLVEDEIRGDIKNKKLLTEDLHTIFITTKYKSVSDYFCNQYSQIDDTYGKRKHPSSTRDKKQQSENVYFDKLIAKITHSEGLIEVICDAIPRYDEFLYEQLKSSAATAWSTAQTVQKIHGKLHNLINTDASLPAVFDDVCNKCKYDVDSLNFNLILVYEGACSLYNLGADYFK